MKAQVRPRRRRNRTIGEHLRAVPRGVALAVPATLVALLGASLVASATAPSPQSDAVRPAVVSTTSAPAQAAVRDDTLERTTRLLAAGRPPLSNLGADAQRKQDQTDRTKAAKKKSDLKAKVAAKAEAKAKAKAKAEAKANAAKAKSKAKKEAAAKARARFVPTAAQLEVTGHRYAKVSLNVRTQPENSSELVTVLDRRSRLSVTGTTRGSWTLVLHQGTGRWVHTRYLAKKKPKSSSSSSSSSSSGGISHRACTSGSGMEHGLRPDAILVHRAVCARWPSIKSYGGLRSGGDSFHSTGQAVDVMIPSSKVGQQVADWVRANHKRLGVSQVIWSQHIWTVQRGSEGWRSMSDRGNRTANHYDHVHVSVYGNAATA